MCAVVNVMVTAAGLLRCMYVHIRCVGAYTCVFVCEGIISCQRFSFHFLIKFMS